MECLCCTEHLPLRKYSKEVKKERYTNYTLYWEFDCINSVSHVLHVMGCLFNRKMVKKVYMIDDFREFKVAYPKVIYDYSPIKIEETLSKDFSVLKSVFLTENIVYTSCTIKEYMDFVYSGHHTNFEYLDTSISYEDTDVPPSHVYFDLEPEPEDLTMPSLN